MSPVSRFALVERNGSAPELLFDGERVAAPANARFLAAQLEHEGMFLLLLTEDSPYEESLQGVLLGKDGQLLETVKLSNPYTGGLVTALQVSGPNSVEFGFFGDDRWRLTILKEPKRHLLKRLSSPVQYRSKWGNHLLDLKRVS